MTLHFADYDTLHFFYFRQINVLIILNILTHRQNVRQVWKRANYLLSKLSFMALVLQTLLFTQVTTNFW